MRSDTPDLDEVLSTRVPFRARIPDERPVTAFSTRMAEVQRNLGAVTKKRRIEKLSHRWNLLFRWFVLMSVGHVPKDAAQAKVLT